MIILPIILLLASILALVVSVFSTVGIGSAYAQNGLSGFIPNEDFETEAMPSWLQPGGDESHT